MHDVSIFPYSRHLVVFVLFSYYIVHHFYDVIIHRPVIATSYDVITMAYRSGPANAPDPRKMPEHEGTG